LLMQGPINEVTVIRQHPVIEIASLPEPNKR
jgi:hypothetical protein